jgi:hypothetical protein
MKVSASEWITGREARTLLGGIAFTTLQRLAILGHIRTKIDPGVPPRFHRGDVLRSRPQVQSTRPRVRSAKVRSI